jgi:hypothetical protein
LRAAVSRSEYKTRPTSVYLAYPESDYQIEVFDPSPTRAVELVTSGQVKQVGAPPQASAESTAASVQQLKALAVIAACRSYAPLNPPTGVWACGRHSFTAPIVDRERGRGRPAASRDEGGTRLGGLDKRLPAQA